MDSRLRGNDLCRDRYYSLRPFGIIMNQALAHTGRPVVLDVKFDSRSAGALEKRKAACRAAFLLISLFRAPRGRHLDLELADHGIEAYGQGGQVFRVLMHDLGSGRDVVGHAADLTHVAGDVAHQ